MLLKSSHWYVGKKGKKDKSKNEGDGSDEDRRKKLNTVTPGPYSAPLPQEDAMVGKGSTGAGSKGSAGSRGFDKNQEAGSQDDGGSSDEEGGSDEEDLDHEAMGLLGRIFNNVFSPDFVEKCKGILTIDDELLGPTIDETMTEYVFLIKEPKMVEDSDVSESESEAEEVPQAEKMMSKKSHTPVKSTVGSSPGTTPKASTKKSVKKSATPLGGAATPPPPTTEPVKEPSESPPATAPPTSAPETTPPPTTETATTPTTGETTGGSPEPTSSP